VSTQYDFNRRPITTSYLGFLSRCTIAASVLNTVAFMSYKTNNAAMLITVITVPMLEMLLETQRSNCLGNATSQCILRKAQVTRTYSEVCVFQFQDINKLLNKTSIQDCVQVFLSRIGVDCNIRPHYLTYNIFNVLHYLHFNDHFYR